MKVEIRKRTTITRGNTWYHVCIDGESQECYSTYEEAKEIADKIIANGGNTTYETLWSNETVISQLTTKND